MPNKQIKTGLLTACSVPLRFTLLQAIISPLFGRYVTTMLKKTFSIILMVCCVLFAYFTLTYVRGFYIDSQNELTAYAIESLSTKVDTEGKIELGLAGNIIQAAAEPNSWLALIDILIFLIIFFLVFMFCVVVHYERKIEKSHNKSLKQDK